MEIQIIDSSGKVWATTCGRSEIKINTLSTSIYFILVKKEDLVETFKFQK